MSIIIHVNRQHIAQNAKDGGNRPVYTIKTPGDPVRYAREVLIQGPSRLVYNGTQLNCGARAWIETEGPLELIGEMSYDQAKKSVEPVHPNRGTSLEDVLEEDGILLEATDYALKKILDWKLRENASQAFRDDA
jgi:hypothetical protein